jgi:putative flippase GtrA
MLISPCLFTTAYCILAFDLCPLPSAFCLVFICNRLHTYQDKDHFRNKHFGKRCLAVNKISGFAKIISCLAPIKLTSSVVVYFLNSFGPKTYKQLTCIILLRANVFKYYLGYTFVHNLLQTRC